MPRRPGRTEPPREPWVVEHCVRESRRGKAVDVRFRIAFEGGDASLGPEGLREQALAELRRVVAALENDGWQQHSTLAGGRPRTPVKGPVEGPFHAPAERRPPRPGIKWQRPDLSPKDLRTCHELLEGLLLLGVHGKAVPVGELARRRSIPQGRLYHVIDPESPGYAYLAPYIKDLRSHGRRLLDLTPEGRVLASRIRAGELKPEAKGR